MIRILFYNFVTVNSQHNFKLCLKLYFNKIILNINNSFLNFLSRKFLSYKNNYFNWILFKNKYIKIKEFIMNKYTNENKQTIRKIKLWIPLILALIYIVVPIDLVPDFIPIVGWREDTLFIIVGITAILIMFILAILTFKIITK